VIEQIKENAMKRNRYLVALFVFFLLAFAVSPVGAVTYKFKVEKSTSDIYLNADGTATVEYTYVFVNDPTADPIDAVDIGLPTSSYSLSNVTAEIDNSPITDIEKSPYVNPGIALNLHAKQIMPGKTGTVHVVITNIRGMLFKTDKVENVSEAYASFQFSPNSFGSEFVRGTTDVTITLHLPPGMNEEEPRYFTPQNWRGEEAPSSGIDAQDRVFYTWQNPSGSSSTQYIFGSAFPARLVPAETLLVESPISTGGSADPLDFICHWVMCLGFFGFIGVSLFGSISASKKRRMQYLPPKIALEGNGIKRGLTAVEAAILLEQPLDKILSMMLFSVVKKGGAEVVSKDPLKIAKLEAASDAGLHNYEQAFIEAMTNTEKGATRKGLQKMMVDLVKSISEKMRGFSRRETVAYYQDLMKKAWAQVEAAGTPEVQMQKFDEVMEWTMLDRRFNDRSQEFFGRGTVYAPVWWNRYDPSFGRSTPATSIGPSQVGSAPTGMSMPTLPGADFAASITSSIQSFSSNVVGDITSFTSGVTNSTNPVPVQRSSGGGGGGGGRSCACACACAGCACACAGGGR